MCSINSSYRNNLLLILDPATVFEHRDHAVGLIPGIGGVCGIIESHLIVIRLEVICQRTHDDLAVDAVGYLGLERV